MVSNGRRIPRQYKKKGKWKEGTARFLPASCPLLISGAQKSSLALAFGRVTLTPCIGL